MNLLEDCKSNKLTLIATYKLVQDAAESLGVNLDGPLFGGLIIQRAFWEHKLKTFLENQQGRYTAVCNHVRRLFEAAWENRFALIGKLVAWEHQLTR